MHVVSVTIHCSVHSCFAVFYLKCTWFLDFSIMHNQSWILSSLIFDQESCNLILYCNFTLCNFFFTAKHQNIELIKKWHFFWFICKKNSKHIYNYLIFSQTFSVLHCYYCTQTFGSMFLYFTSSQPPHTQGHQHKLFRVLEQWFELGLKQLKKTTKIPLF